MSRNWTQEERERHSSAIQSWKPWLHSTGPTTEEGKAVSSRNALKTGLHSEAGKELRRLLAQQLKWLAEIEVDEGTFSYRKKL